MKKLSIATNNLASTEKLGRTIGAHLRGGEVIELVSDVGGGKTTLVRAIAAGAGSKDTVTSPTFTINKLYQAAELTLAHFDFYRLNDAGVVASELAEHLEQTDTVVLIEWPELINDLLPDRRLRILIEASGETKRTFCLEYPPSLAYLVEGAK